MKKTKKALASFAIAGMTLSMIPFNAFANTAMPTRIAGNTAADTAVQIADQTGYTGAAILASSASYGMVDALTAGPLAASLKAPILLTGAGSSLDAATKAELTKLAVKTVYVTSGTAVISQGVLNELTGMGITVVPLGGYDRAETSVNIAKKMSGVTKVAVANGLQDALSIASVAAAANEPILLTDRDSLPASVSAYLAANSGITATDVIGGTGVISDAVKAALPSATRHAGYTAYDTNNQVIQDFAAALQFDNVFAANGVTGIDALAGAPLAAQTKSPIVLTDGKSVPSVAAFTFSKSSASTVVTALGGEAVVPETVRTGIAAGQVTAQPGDLSITSVSALDDANQYLEIDFSGAVSALNPSDITIANADTGERYGVQAVTLSSDGMKATVQLYGNDNNNQLNPVLSYLTDYNITVNANGKILTSVFNRSYSVKSRVLSIDPTNNKFTIVCDKTGTGSTDVTEGDTQTITVPSSVDFDYYGALGEQVQVWYNNDNELSSYKITSSTSKVDGVKVKDNNTFTLIGADKDYDITSDNYKDGSNKFDFYVNGQKQSLNDNGVINTVGAGDSNGGDYIAAGTKYSFAKIGFDSSGDINFVSAYTLPDKMIYDHMDGDSAVGLDGSDDSFDTSDATLVKDGKVIDPSELTKGDLIVFSNDANDGDGYGEVVSGSTVTGSIDEVYADSIEVGGNTYQYAYDSDAQEYNYETPYAIYINDSGDVKKIDQDAADELQAAGDVTLYLDPAGNLLYVSGDTAEVDTNTKVAALTDDIVGYKSAKDKIDVEAVTQDGDDVSYDINLDSLDKIEVDGTDYKIDNKGNNDWTASVTDQDTGDTSKYDTLLLTPNANTSGSPVSVALTGNNAPGAAGSFVKLHLDDNGNLQKLEFYKGTSTDGGAGVFGDTLQAGDAYLDGYKMTDSTLMFKADKADGTATKASDYTISNFGDYNGSDINGGHFVYNDNGEVVAVWYSDTSSSDNDYQEAVVEKVLRNTDDEIVSISGWVAGEEKTFTVDKVSDPDESVQKGDAVVLRFDDNNDTVVEDVNTAKIGEEHNQYTGRVTDPSDGSSLVGLSVVSIDASNKKVTFSNGDTYKLADLGLVLNAKDTSDIKKKALSDLKDETNVTVVLDATNGNYAKFFVMRPAASDAQLLAAAKTAAASAETAYTTAGGQTTDAVYLAVDAAVASNVTADINTTTTALNAATTALTNAKSAASAAQTAYKAAGGSESDADYIAVSDAVSSGVTVDIVSATNALKADTQTLIQAAKVAAALANVNAATGSPAAMEAALTSNATTLGLDLSAYNGLTNTQKDNVASYLIAHAPFATAPDLQAGIAAGML